ncbi:MAG: hypothetical protein ACFFA1_01465 [Promethearchaeota archaeon]
MSASLPIVSTHFDSVLDNGPICKPDRTYNLRCLEQPLKINYGACAKYQKHNSLNSIRYLAWVDEVIERCSYTETLDYSASARRKHMQAHIGTNQFLSLLRDIWSEVIRR